MEIVEFLKASGVLVIPLLACSVIAMTIILERFFYWLIFWWRVDLKGRQRIMLGDTHLTRSSDRVAEVLRAVVCHPNEPSIANVEAERVMRDSRRFLKVINWVATLSTSLGLLGTVVGVSMALKDLNDPSKLTPALAVALNTTIIGLVIYLVTYTFASLFTSRSNKLGSELKELMIETRRYAMDRSNTRNQRASARMRAASHS
ncbi:MAG: MotA/TolQ/ExbB proton channel family protein [Planctomycetota bacterium]|nr:MotA/TolQ/ExbB proton channel family protein [Planctomycetota bacterium]